MRKQTVSGNLYGVYGYQPPFSAVEVQRLTEGARPALAAHFLAMPPDDRRLRFGASLSAERIEGYVEEIDLGRDAVFGYSTTRLR